MARRFYSRQLLAVEDELHEVGMRADALALELGIRADDMHFDGAPARPVDEAIAECQELSNRMQRAIGLLRACKLVFEQDGDY